VINPDALLLVTTICPFTSSAKANVRGSRGTSVVLNILLPTHLNGLGGCCTGGGKEGEIQHNAQMPSKFECTRNAARPADLNALGCAKKKVSKGGMGKKKVKTNSGLWADALRSEDTIPHIVKVVLVKEV